MIEQIKKLLEKAPKETLQNLVDFINKQLGVSDHFKWAVEWKIDKYLGTELIGTELIKENIVLDNGATELLKLLGGLSGATAFSNSNARLYVGSDASTENAAQTGVVTELGNTGMEVGYPQMSGNRSLVFRGIFGEGVATGEWKEVSVYNGTGASSIALNRKVGDMGRKASEQAWTLQVTITLLSV